MTGRQLATTLLVGSVGLSGAAVLLPGRLQRALIDAATRLAEDLASAIDDAMDVFEEEAA